MGKVGKSSVTVVGAVKNSMGKNCFVMKNIPAPSKEAEQETLLHGMESKAKKACLLCT